MDDMHPTFAEVNVGAIRRNVSRIREKVHPAGVMAVVKSDGYGLGAVPVARAAVSAGAELLGVAHPAEGRELRQAGINTPIQVFGGFFPEQIDEYLEANLEFTLTDLPRAKVLAATAAARAFQPPVHVKFDTGMGRVGFPWREAREIFAALRRLPALRWRGLMTHFATADEPDSAFAREQLRRFQHVVAAAQAAGLDFEIRHAANSGAVLHLPESYFDMVRAGIAIYGYYPAATSRKSVALEPALRWHSRLLQVKRLSRRQPVSYGATWRAPRDTMIGTVATGYGDGYSRALSNRIHAAVGGRRAPVVGRVCMDMIMLDLGPDTTAQTGETVTLLGSEGAAATMDDFCRALDTIPYEVICRIGKRVPRVYIDQ